MTHTYKPYFRIALISILLILQAQANAQEDPSLSDAEAVAVRYMTAVVAMDPEGMARDLHPDKFEQTRQLLLSAYDQAETSGQLSVFAATYGEDLNRETITTLPGKTLYVTLVQSAVDASGQPDVQPLVEQMTIESSELQSVDQALVRLSFTVAGQAGGGGILLVRHQGAWKIVGDQE